MQYSVEHYCTVQYTTNSIVQYSTVRYNIVQYSIEQYRTVTVTMTLVGCHERVNFTAPVYDHFLCLVQHWRGVTEVGGGGRGGTGLCCGCTTLLMCGRTHAIQTLIHHPAPAQPRQSTLPCHRAGLLPASVCKCVSVCARVYECIFEFMCAHMCVLCMCLWVCLWVCICVSVSECVSVMAGNGML